MFLPLFDESASAGTTGAATVPDESVSDGAPSESTAAASDSTSVVAGAQPGGALSTPTATAPAALTVFDRIRNKHGIDFAHKYKSEDDLLDGLVNASRLIGQRNTEAEVGRLYGQHINEFQEFLKQRQTQGQPGAQPPLPPVGTQPQAWKWEPPDWQQHWNSYLDAETGQPREDTPMDVRAAFQKRQDFFNAHREKLVFDFPNAVKPLLEQQREQIMREVQEQYAQREQQLQVTTEAAALRDQNASWIYMTDAQGRVVTDEVGRKLFTPAGQVMMNYIVEAERGGIRNVKMQFDYAYLKTQQHMGLMQAQQAATTGAAPQNQVPNTAIRSPNSNAGSAPSGAKVEGTAGLSLKDRLMRKAKGMPEEAFAA